MCLRLCLSWILLTCSWKALLLVEGKQSDARGSRRNYLRSNDPSLEVNSASIKDSRSLATVNLTAATTPLIGWQEKRSTYVHYPESAEPLLEDELRVINAAIGLDVTTSMLQPEVHLHVWSLLKGIVHRFRKQNQIIHANPHYYVQTGVEVGCRQVRFDPDTGRGTELEVLPQPDHCQTHCTNHGRYCLLPSETSPITGKDLLEETLRRICFAQIYHASDLRFWEYQEELQYLQCPPGNTACSRQALNHVPQTSPHALDNCMQLAGGITEDNPNVHLQFEIDHRTSTKSAMAYQVGDIPLLHVEGRKYQSNDWSVEGIFPFVCQVYRDKTGFNPVGCQFCEHCQDVRKCLWKLECDGRPFVANALEHEQATLPPAAPTETLAPEAPKETNAPVAPPSESTNPAFPSNDETATRLPEQETQAAVTASTTEPPYIVGGPVAWPGEHQEGEEHQQQQEEEPKEETSSPTTAPSSSPSASPSAAPTTFDQREERKRQEEEMNELYLKWFIAVMVVLGSVVMVFLIRDLYRRRQKYLAEQYLNETQSRWRARELDNMSDAYSNDWPIGLVQQNKKNTRISRKDRKKKGSSSALNQDHSQTGQRTGRFPGFTRNLSLENTPIIRNLTPPFRTQKTPPSHGPAFGRHQSLDTVQGALRPGRRRPSYDEAEMVRARDNSARFGRRSSWNDDSRVSTAHTIALMEAAATSSPMPSQPMGGGSMSSLNSSSHHRRQRRTSSLEDILDDEGEENSIDSGNDSFGNLGPNSERSTGSIYSTNWLTGSGAHDANSNYRDMFNENLSGGGNDASEAFDGLEDITTL